MNPILDSCSTRTPFAGPLSPRLGWLGAVALSLYSLANPVPTSDAESVEVERLPRTVVYGEAESEGVAQEPFFPPVQGTEIFSGKKATLIDLDTLPQVQANNYRQALTQTPGLLYSEETTPLVSLGYRGIGEPHRAPQPAKRRGNRRPGKLRAAREHVDRKPAVAEPRHEAPRHLLAAAENRAVVEEEHSHARLRARIASRSAGVGR